MHGWLLLLVFFLSGCTYTFLPLEPERVPFPQRPSLTGKLVEEGKTVIAQLEVRRMPKPGYIELRWYLEETILAERSLWAEGPGKYRLELPRPQEGYYRLIVLIENAPLLQLDLGRPSLPSPPPPPEAPAES
jgi:hypothetical protein